MTTNELLGICLVIVILGMVMFFSYYINKDVTPREVSDKPYYTYTYKLAMGGLPNKLEYEVKRLVTEGYVAHGNLIVNKDNIYLQPMIKEEYNLEDEWE